MFNNQSRYTATLALLLLGYSIVSQAALTAPTVESDIANTKHNLSANSTNTIKSDAGGTQRICVFCHTPHGATANAGPLWNRALSSQTYTLYDSDSLDATNLTSPTAVTNAGATSKLCLSCHDGTIALGTVNVISGLTGQTVAGLTDNMATEMTNAGATDGYTRNLGNDLANDHPISFTYDGTLAGNDGELYDPTASPEGDHIAVRTSGANPDVPLQNVPAGDSATVQCTSCHDPHIRDMAAAPNQDKIKFLRLNRFQVVNEPVEDKFTKADDIICIACHKKMGWAGSVHASKAVAEETYVDPVNDRDFPAGIAVWEAACLNCHDTHTVTGANRLQRGGVSGGAAATEETCYQCHDGSGAIVAASVANIKADFALARSMPITDAQQGSTEGAAHAIGTGADGDEGSKRGKDFVEDNAAASPGVATRHAECTDCHNPHRMMRNAQFDGGGISTQGTHLHVSTTTHTNEASGVLSGTWGVEPDYTTSTTCGTSTSWDTCSPTYNIVRGAHDDTLDSYNPVSKEYQICLKCHSSYAYGALPPSLPATGALGGTPSSTNGMTVYTDQAKEFQGVGVADAGNANHVSFHPVLTNTGRNVADRGGMNHSNFKTPFNNTTPNSIGSQTMYCTDCHGSETAMGTSEPTGTNPWGPHGSGKDFILKGNWDADATSTMGADSTSTNPVSLCFRCHDYNAYSNPASNGATYQSGFSGTTGGGCSLGGTNPTSNMHIGHRNRIGKDLRCTWCHVAVPHGWKNKALLVDTRQSATIDNCGANSVNIDADGTNLISCNNPPYYVNAMLGGGGNVAFQTSGNWGSANCGGGNGFNSWMNRNCSAPP